MFENSESKGFFTLFFILPTGIHASILAEVHVVDLSLSSKEIQELMLTQLLQPEDGELLIQHLRLKNYNQLLHGKMAAEKVAEKAFCVGCFCECIGHWRFFKYIFRFVEEKQFYQANMF